MRIYVDLSNGHEHILDPDGIEVENHSAAHREIVRALRELYDEISESHSEWLGWSMVFTDDFGRLLFRIDLSLVGEGNYLSGISVAGSALLH